MCSQSTYTLVASTPRLCVPGPYISAHIPGLCVPAPPLQHQHVFCRRLSLSVSKQKWLICPLMAHIVEKQPHSPLVGQTAKSGIAFEKQTVQQLRLLERNLWGFLLSASHGSANFCYSQRGNSATRCELGALGKMTISQVTVHGVSIHFLLLREGHQRNDNVWKAEVYFIDVLEAG